MKKPGDTSINKKAELDILAKLGSEMNINLAGKKLYGMQVDGYSENPPVLCEVWAHIGPPKSAQVSKVMKDAFKLLFIEKTQRKKYKKIVAFADKEACKPFITESRSWMAKCLRTFGIKIKTIKLLKSLHSAVRKQQKINYR